MDTREGRNRSIALLVISVVGSIATYTTATTSGASTFNRSFINTQMNRYVVVIIIFPGRGFLYFTYYRVWAMGCFYQFADRFLLLQEKRREEKRKEKNINLSDSAILDL